MAKMKVTGVKNSYSTSKTVKEQYKTVAGPKVDYSQYFMEAPKAPEYYTPTVKTDAEIMSEANALYKDLYDTYIANSEREREKNVNSIREEIAELDPVYAQRAALLRDSYKDKDRQLRNEAMSKGMGRSSYLIDSRNENSRRLNRDISSVNSEKARETAALQRDIREQYVDYQNQKELYEAKRDYEVNKLAAEMEKERSKTLFDAQKYNDELYENYSKLLLNQKKHNLSVQKYIDELNTRKITVTTTTKSTKTTTYKAQDGIDREAVEALWSQMSGGQKIKYVQKNAPLLKAGAPDLYGKYSTEAGLYGVNTALEKLKNLVL